MRSVNPLLAFLILACGLCAPARAAGDVEADAEADAAADAAPAAQSSTTELPPRPEHAVMGDTNSDPAKVFRRKGGPDRAVVRGGAVIINADGTRLEIAPSRRPAPEIPAPAAPSGPVKLALPALPVLDDPKAGLAERRRRAQYLLGASVAAAFLLFYWARSRWRPDL
jgi:hypothetical protein